MSGFGVPLTSATRSNLTSLTATTQLLSRTQLRLATGKKVNTAADNATAFFASAGFLNRAEDFNRVKDSLSTAISTLNAASNAIDAITKVVNQAQGLVTTALQSSDTTVRSGLATQFNGVVDSDQQSGG
jgi:flagellin